MILNFDSNNPFQLNQPKVTASNKKNQKTQTQFLWPVFHQLAQAISSIFVSINLKIWTFLTILAYLLTIINFGSWAQDYGYNEQYTKSLLIIILYKFIKIFSYLHSQQTIISQSKSKNTEQNDKVISRYLFAVVKPLQLFWISKIVCQMALASKLQIMVFSVFFGAFAPYITSIAQKQTNLFIKQLKGKYLMIVIAYLIIFSIRPILRYVLIFDYYLPQCLVFVAFLYILALFFIIAVQAICKVMQNKTNQKWCNIGRQLIILFSLIFFPLSHCIFGYHLDTILNTRFDQRTIIVLLVSVLAGNKFIQNQLKIRRRLIYLPHVAFCIIYTILIPLVYIVPIYGKMGDIVFYCLHGVFFIPSFVFWLAQFTYSGIVTLKKHKNVII